MTNTLNRILTFLAKYGIWLVLLLALVLRVIKLHNAFYGSTSEIYRDMLVMHQLLIEKQMVWQGPVSSLGGFRFGPVYFYLMAPFVWLFRFRPEGAIFLSTFFSMASIGMSYKLLRVWSKDLFLPLLTAFLLSISFLDIQNAYYISNPNILPFFVVSFLYLISLWLRGNNNIAIFAGIGVSLGIATQLHATAMVILPAMLIAVVLASKKLPRLEQAAALVAAGVIMYIPYLYYELTHHFTNFFSILNLGGSNFSLVVRQGSLLSVGNFFMSFLWYRNGYFDMLQFNSRLFFVSLILVCVLVLWSLYEYRKLKSPIEKCFNQTGRFLLLIWLIVPLPIFLFFKKDMQVFYFLSLWPLPIIGFAAFVFSWRNYSKRLALAWVGLYICLQFAQMHYFFGNLTNKSYDDAKLKQSFRLIETDAGTKTYNIQNGTDNINLFIYYMHATGAVNKIFRKDASLLYYVYGNNGSEELISTPVNYTKMGEFIAGNLRVVKLEHK